MSKKFLVIAALIAIMPIAFFGCKGKVEKAPEGATPETSVTTPSQEETAVTQPVEPAQTVATETIPPTAAPSAPAVEKAQAPVKEMAQNRNKDIQTALKNAGFYNGNVDGKIGSKTKKAIEEFQKAKGLKADGKVGPKTWTELSKYLTKPQQ